MDDSSEETSTNSITKISNLKICEVLKYKVFFSSLSGCNGYVGYGVQVVWSELGYAAICSGASSMLAR